MAAYNEDFSGGTPGSPPSGWTERWATTDPVWSVETGGDDQILKCTITTGTQVTACSRNDVDSDADRDDVEILTKFQVKSVSAATYQGGAVARGSGGTSTKYGYVAAIYDNDFRVYKQVNNTSTSLATNARTLTTNTWYWLRFRVNGTSLRARIWADGGSEPGSWDIDTTDSSISAAGWVGAYGHNPAADPEYDLIAIATNGDTASVGGAAAALEGAPAAQSTAAGVLTTQIPLTGAAAVVATAAGALSTSIPLAGQAASVSVAGGVLTTTITLAGSALAQATAAGALAGGAAALSGDAAAQASAAASLTTQITLSGAAVAQALAAAGLTTAPAGLSGTAQAQAQAAGALLTQIPLAGVAAAYVTGTGNLSTIIHLAGAAASVTGATGTLTIEATLSGTALAQALAAGSLTTVIRLNGAALAQAVASGNLDAGLSVLPVDPRFTLHADRRAANRFTRWGVPDRITRIAA